MPSDSFLRRTGFGGDHHHAVRGHRTVKRRSRRAFQNRDVLDVLGIDRRHDVAEVEARTAPLAVGALQLRVVNRHAVDDVKRQVRTRKLGITADQHARRSRRAGRRRRNIDSGDLSDHRLHDVRLASGRQVLLAHRRHGVTQCLGFTLDTQGRDYDFTHGNGLLLEYDFETGFAADGNRLCRHTDERNLQGGVLVGYVQREPTFRISRRAAARPLLDDRGSDNRLLRLIRHDTRNGNILLSHCRGAAEDRQEQHG